VCLLLRTDVVLLLLVLHHGVSIRIDVSILAGGTHKVTTRDVGAEMVWRHGAGILLQE
jgi:hypothetical protein